MKKITQKLLILTIFGFGFQSSYATGISVFCQTTVTHLNLPAETASGVKLTISKVDATSMYVEIESANADAVDLLLVNNGSGAIISDPDVSVAGKIKRTLTWATPPADVSIELLWSKVSMPGNWMINTFVVPFDASCSGGTTDTQNPTAFTATKGAVTGSSVELLLNATDNSGSVTYTITYGTTTLTTTGTSGTQKSYIVSGLSGSTSYSFSIAAKDAAGNVAANNPIVVPAVTTAPVAVQVINFETFGQDWTWTVFQNGPGGTDFAGNLTTPVANPSATGINTSASCAKFIEDPTAAPWGGFFSDNIGTFTFNATNKIVKVMVYKDKISPFGVKFEGPSGNPAFEMLLPNTKINEWEEMTFDFSSKIGQTVKRLVFLPDFAGTRTSGGTIYIDNISLSDGLTADIQSTSADINAIRCYPNPSINILNVTAKSEISQVIVRNLIGQLIKTISVSAREKTIDLSDVSSGNYIVTVKLANGNLSNQKIVKQ